MMFNLSHVFVVTIPKAFFLYWKRRWRKQLFWVSDALVDVKQGSAIRQFQSDPSCGSVCLYSRYIINVHVDIRTCSTDIQIVYLG